MFDITKHKTDGFAVHTGIPFSSEEDKINFWAVIG
jgi:hypothetical protein